MLNVDRGPAAPEARTGSTLFNVIRNPGDARAWSAFVERYAPQIFGWCRQRGLQQADAEDVTQLILTKLVLNMRACTYDPKLGSFGAWLKTATVRACLDAQKAGGRYQGSGDPNVQELLGNQEGREDLTRALEQQYEAELLEQALALTQLRVGPRDWQVFHALALEGRSGKEVAAEQGLAVATVFSIRSRVQAQVRQEVERLDR